MITYSKAYSEKDLQGILKLQKANLAQNLTPEAIINEGFVTVDHSYRQLEMLNAVEKHVIAKDGEMIVGYILVMTKPSGNQIPVLVPMFKEFDHIIFQEQLVKNYNYIVVGQVCIDEAFRGLGVLDNCYACYKEFYESRYDFAITEIAVYNSRSLKAHKRIGFQTIASYIDPAGTEWNIVLWNWRYSNRV